MNEPTIDDEFAGLHREQTLSEYALLKEDLKMNGQLEAILAWEEGNVIIDGHHRFKALKELGKEPIVIYRSFESREAVIFYIKLHQAGRRNETAREYAMNLLSLRQSCLALDKSGPNLARLSIKAIAEMCNLSENTLKKLDIVVKYGDDGLIEEVKSGKKSASRGREEAKPTKPKKEAPKEGKSDEKGAPGPESTEKGCETTETGESDPNAEIPNSKDNENRENEEKKEEKPKKKRSRPSNAVDCPYCEGDGWVEED